MNSATKSVAAITLALSLATCTGGSDPPQGIPFLPTAALAASDVQNLISGAVTQATHDGAAVVVAISDREGNVLGQFTMTGAPGNSPNPDALNTTTAALAIEKARTAAFLSSDQDAFSTRTGGFIVNEHFPPGIKDTPNGPLFGLPFSQLPCSDAQLHGNGISGVPGGIPVYLNGAIAGGIGVDGASPDEDEILALAGASGIYGAPDPITADKIFLGGIQLLYIGPGRPTPGLTPIAFGALPGTVTVAPTPTPPTAFPAATFLGVPGEIRFPIISSPVAIAAPDGSDLRLTAADVNNLITDSVAQEITTRAAIRQPIGVPGRFQIGVTDIAGNILGVFRTNDATMFSLDIVIQKGRTVTAFSDPHQQLGLQIRKTLGLSPNQPFAVTTRTTGFLAQPFYPPGIDGNPPGPLFRIQEQEVANGTPCLPYTPGDGITLFPGSVPLYKQGVLVGGLGVSGDGVDQDDFVTNAGAQGYLPDPGIRADTVEFQGTRLPFLKFPRDPKIN